MTETDLTEMQRLLARYEEGLRRRLYGEHIAVRRRPLETLLVRHAAELIAAAAQTQARKAECP